MENNRKNIAMLSIHGYFDPVPQLGRTDTGGQVVYILELAKALLKLGHKVDIYTRWFEQSKKQIDPVPDYPDVRIVRIKAGPWKFIAKEYIYDVLPELSKNMVAFIKENNLNYDLFHGHYVDAGIVTLDVAKDLEKPAFFTAHSLGAWKKQQMCGDPEKMEEKFKFKHRISEEIRIFKTVTAQSITSMVQKDKLKELYNFESDNIEVIPPGVDVHRFYPLTKNNQKINSELPDKYIFCLSRIDTNKGHRELLYAFDIMKKETNDVYLIIGGGSPKPKTRELSVFDMMRKIIDEKQMHNKVKIIGYVPDELLAAYYQQAVLFVLPSKFEPFGMTALESMACGKTVVASKFGGIRNIISNGENGLLIDPTNSKEFAKAIIKLLRNENLNMTLGLNAYSTIFEKYSWEAIAKRFNTFFDKYLNIRKH